MMVILSLFVYILVWYCCCNPYVYKVHTKRDKISVLVPFICFFFSLSYMFKLCNIKFTLLLIHVSSLKKDPLITEKAELIIKKNILNLQLKVNLFMEHVWIYLKFVKILLTKCSLKCTKTKIIQ